MTPQEEYEWVLIAIIFCLVMVLCIQSDIVLEAAKAAKFNG